MSTMSSLLKAGGAGLALLLGVAHAAAQCPFQGDPNRCDPTRRQINITGATLFRAFFEAPASTNDYIDVDGDGCFGFGKEECFPNNVDQLAPPIIGNDPWWIVQHRSVGSVKGFEEFVTFQLCCDLPDILPTERSTINHQLYFDGQNIVWPGETCNIDIDGDGKPDRTGTPICHCSMDLAIVDVVSPWVVVSDPDDENDPNQRPLWSRKPTQKGYGLAPFFSYPLPGCQNPGPLESQLERITRDCDGDPNTPDAALNFNFDNPDENTIYDTTIAFVNVVPIANRGAYGRAYNGNDPSDAPALSYSEMQHMYVTGRSRTGENFAIVTRDTGSGTRNAWNNSIGVDPSWGRGDNEGGRTTATSDTNLGPCHRVSNCGSSSHVENATQQRRLAVGYTGLSGNTSAAADAHNGLYEILNVIKDVPPYNAQLPVRPTVSSILDNADPNYGYQIGGSQTFVSRGDPYQSDPGRPDYMENQNAADYLVNIVESIRGFTDPNGIEDPNNNLMPGQYLAQTFFLFGSLDAEQTLLDPLLFLPTDPNDFNQQLQDYIRANSNLGVAALAPDGIVTPAYGSRNTAGLVPNRSQGAYSYWNGGNERTIGAGKKLSQSNRLQADFNQDGRRDINDIAPMLQCLANKSGFDTSDNGGERGDMEVDVIVPDVMGDQDGDGDFDGEDVRYFADGLAIDNQAACPALQGTLNRKKGFVAVDTAFGGNFFGTQVFDERGGARSYVPGASRLDVSNPRANDPNFAPRPGAKPYGHDGRVTKEDFDYVRANFGDWRDLNQAVDMDLSCDMNGDLHVDWCDLMEFAPFGYTVEFCQGDLDGNGVIGLGDLATLLASYNQCGVGYFKGDLDCDGSVGLSDLAALLARWNQPCD